MGANIELDALVESYGAHDEESKRLKKICDGEKEQIKSIFSNSEMSTYTSGGYSVELRESNTIKMDEELMLEVLKRAWIEQNGSLECPYIKTREYIDSDVLEGFIYSGEIPNEVLAELEKCKITTTKYALYCKKSKGE